MSIAKKEFIKELQQEVLQHEAVNHQFFKRFATGDLTLEQVRRFAVHYYQHILRTRLYVASVLSITPDEDTQMVLTKILYDEYGDFDKEKTHPALYRRFMRALGLQENDWEGIEPIPELTLYIDRHYTLCRDADYLVGLGAVGPASEWPVPVIFSRIVEGLTKWGQIDEKDMEIFTSHIILDDYHASIIMEQIGKVTDSVENQQKVRLGTLRSLEARKIFMDGMYRIVFT